MPIDERFDNDEYAEKYLKSDHYKSKEYSSRILNNFLSDEELAVFDEATRSPNIMYVHDTCMARTAKELLDEPEEDHTTAHYHIFDNFYSDPAWKHLVDIIQPKLEEEFGSNIMASHIHVLTSHFPYGLHNDADQSSIKIAPKPAWTLIIPFDDFPSKTYVFNERSGFKDPWSWIHANGIEPKDDYSIDRETFAKDFDPFTDYELMRYLTVETTYPWRKGSCFAADRYKYHCSDNYYNHGIRSKRAIIIWTSVA